MPKNKPEVSWLHIRDYAERWQWKVRDPQDTAIVHRQIGYNPPKDAFDIERHPFWLRAITQTGKIIEGECVTLSVNTYSSMRRVQFVSGERKGEIRWVFDRFIIEIDGVRFYNH